MNIKNSVLGQHMCYTQMIKQLQAPMHVTLDWSQKRDSLFILHMTFPEKYAIIYIYIYFRKRGTE